MKASELRFGNLIYEVWNGKKDATIFDFTLYQSHDMNGKTHFDSVSKCEVFDKIEPIQLTEEWLLKFGFENIQKGLFKINVLNFGCINIHLTKTRILVELGTYNHSLFGDTKILYVHQIQNLYFALTGSELEIK